MSINKLNINGKHLTSERLSSWIMWWSAWMPPSGPTHQFHLLLKISAAEYSHLYLSVDLVPGQREMSPQGYTSFQASAHCHWLWKREKKFSSIPTGSLAGFELTGKKINKKKAYRFYGILTRTWESSQKNENLKKWSEQEGFLPFGRRKN